MARREAEADRVRRCRLLFQRAQAIGCTPSQVRQRQAEHRWAVTDARLAAKRCGTEIDADEGHELQWFQR